MVAAGGRLKQLSLDEPSLETIYTRYFQSAQEGPSCGVKALPCKASAW